MSNESKLQDAHRVKMELPETRKAFELVRMDILGQIADSAPQESAKREALYAEISALKSVEAKLVSVINDGAVSAHIIEMKANGY